MVRRRVVEEVSLSVLPHHIAILPSSRNGTFILSMFWMNILRHPRNFPHTDYNYQQIYDPLEKGKQIYLIVEDVELTVNCLTGAFHMRGKDVHSWFMERFPKILKNYDGFLDSELQYADQPSEREKVKSMFTTDEGLVKILYPHNDFLTPLEEEKLQDLWLAEKLNNYLEFVRNPTLKPGRGFVYRMWKSLLHRWLSDPRFTVIAASKQLDPTRLADVMQTVLQFKHSGELEAFYVPMVCDVDATIQQVQVQALKRFTPAEELWLEEKVIRRMRFPDHVAIGCNFIAGMLPALNEVQLLTTSAAFHAHSLRDNDLHQIHYSTLTMENFKHDFLQPLHMKLFDPVEF